MKNKKRSSRQFNIEKAVLFYILSVWGIFLKNQGSITYQMLTLIWGITTLNKSFAIIISESIVYVILGLLWYKQIYKFE